MTARINVGLLLVALACTSSDPSSSNPTDALDPSPTVDSQQSETSDASNGSTTVAAAKALCELMAKCLPDFQQKLSNESEISCPSFVLMVEGLGKVSRSASAKLGAAVMACLKKTGDCDAMKACVQATKEQAAVCTNGEPHDRCAGNVLVECDGTAEPDAFDCGAAGLKCIASQDDARCAESDCVVPTAPSCDGDVMKTCVDGALVTKDCRWNIGMSCTSNGGNTICITQGGGTCAIDPDGSPMCVGTGPACDPKAFKAHCDGAVIVTCVREKEARLDCSAIDPALTCTKTTTKEGFDFFSCKAQGD